MPEASSRLCRFPGQALPAGELTEKRNRAALYPLRPGTILYPDQGYITGASTLSCGFAHLKELDKATFTDAVTASRIRSVRRVYSCGYFTPVIASARDSWIRTILEVEDSSTSISAGLAWATRSITWFPSLATARHSSGDRPAALLTGDHPERRRSCAPTPCIEHPLLCPNFHRL